jgi:hypothetical protein
LRERLGVGRRERRLEELEDMPRLGDGLALRRVLEADDVEETTSRRLSSVSASLQSLTRGGAPASARK